MTENQIRLKTLLEALNTDSVKSFTVRMFNEWTTTYIRKDCYKFARMKMDWVRREWVTQTTWEDGSESKETDNTGCIKVRIEGVLKGTFKDESFTLLEMHLKF